MSRASGIRFAIVLSFCASAAAAGDNWPQFRGAASAGVADGAKLPGRWSATENVAWKVAVPGHGWSSPVMWGKRVFVTSFVGSDAVVAPKSGFYAPRDVSAPAGEFRWVTYCFDADSGKQIWEHMAHSGRPEHTIHVKASYAAETPATDGERLYVYFGNVGLFCYDLDGQLLWSKKWGSFPTRLGWGTGASPIVYGERVYLVNDNEQDSFITALDKRTGQELWRVGRDEKTSWATPFVWRNKARTEIVTCATGKVRSYDLDGKLLWELGGMSSICVPTPITAGDLLIIDSGYEFGKPRPLMAVREGASGDISLKEGESSNQFIAWFHDMAGTYHPTPLYYNGLLYVLYSTGLVACFDPQTGQEVFAKRRLGGSITASPWGADGKIYCLNEDGDTFVLQSGREFKLLETNSLGEMALATPAVTDRGLFIRTLSHLYCIRNPR
jgi:outer membrane protein assembly factor BamB